MDELSKLVTKNENQRKQSDEFMQEVVSINEALVRKVQLLQEKERSRLKNMDSKMRPTLLKGTNASSGKENEPMRYGSSPKHEANVNLNVSQSAAKRIKASVGSYVVARPKLSKNLSMSKLGKEIDRQREVLQDKPVHDSLVNTLRTQSAASHRSTPRDTKKAPSPLRKDTAFEQSFGKAGIKNSLKKPPTVVKEDMTVEEKVNRMFEVEETLLMPVAKITDLDQEECSQVVFRLERELAEKGRQ